VHKALEGLDSEDLFVSVISIGEITKGISLLNESENKQALEQWLATLERYHADRLLPVDRAISRIWGEITAVAQRSGRTLPAADGLIAATALRHGLRIMTRNTADFEPAGVFLLNPWLD